MPPAPADVTDLGCGTGSLSVLLARAGRRVRGLDVADRMVAAATAKAHNEGVAAHFAQGDASAPPYEPASTDVGGRLVLIEGRWSTGVGINASGCAIDDQRYVGLSRG